jgi:hypothetical protein
LVRFLLLICLLPGRGDPLVAQSHSGRSDPKSGQKPRNSLKAPSRVEWSYHMTGNLDQAKLSCRGSATVKQTTDSSRRQRLNWRITKQRCQGSHDVDWLHEDGLTGEIYESTSGWRLKNDLPGRGFCLPKVVRKNGRIVSFSLSCTWECRSARNPCAGLAMYVYTDP